MNDSELAIDPDDTPPGRPPCRVEFLGPARLAAGVKEVAIALPGDTTLSAFIRILARHCPALVGPVLEPETGELAPGYIFNLNGRDFIRDPATRIRPGDLVLLLASAAGG